MLLIKQYSRKPLPKMPSGTSYQCFHKCKYKCFRRDEAYPEKMLKNYLTMGLTMSLSRPLKENLLHNIHVTLGSLLVKLEGSYMPANFEFTYYRLARPPIWRKYLGGQKRWDVLVLR
jgi:hypothetical protein